MKLNKCLFGLMLAAASVLGGKAYAIPMSGSFTLFNDSFPASTAGDVVGNGSFLTTSTNGDQVLAGGVLLNTLTLDAFSVNPLNMSNVPSLSLSTAVTPRPVMGAPPLVAVLNAADSFVIGFYGSIGSTGVMPATYIDFYFNIDDTAVFMSSNGLWGGGLSGIQMVPEPASLALLGAGLIGFGFAKRKKEFSKAA